MSGEDEKFDVRVCSVPARTPQGEQFSIALARIFGVEPSIGEQIARQAPTFVKRRVPLEIAEHLRGVLGGLGAEVEIRSAVAPSVPPRSAWPPGLPSDSPHAPSPGSPSPPPERMWPSPPPRPSARAAKPQSLRPTAPPTARSWTPLPPGPPPRGLQLSTGTVLLGAALAIALAFAGLTHWLRSVMGVGDAQMLGNTPNEQTACGGHFGLTGPGIEADRRAKQTLVVAWRTGCLSDDYRKFLQDLGDAHRGDLAIVGAGLAAPGLLEPPPEPWPPTGCEPGFQMLPVDRGYVSDALSAPATYLYDADGDLVAAWAGGMSPPQRARLTTWLDERGK